MQCDAAYLPDHHSSAHLSTKKLLSIMTVGHLQCSYLMAAGARRSQPPAFGSGRALHSLWPWAHARKTYLMANCLQSSGIPGNEACIARIPVVLHAQFQANISIHTAFSSHTSAKQLYVEAAVKRSHPCRVR